MWMTAQDEESGFVLASTFVKKTEDQLDAYREWIFLILDHPQDIFGWTSKSRAKMERFKEDLVEQICEATEFPKSRLRVVRVLKANKKKSWVALESKNPTFFLGKSLLIWLLPCCLFLHDCFVSSHIAVQTRCSCRRPRPAVHLLAIPGSLVAPVTDLWFGV
jgi:hypothetical protein